MKLKLLPIFLLSILFRGCLTNTDFYIYGVLITNYPEWCFGKLDEDNPNDYYSNYYCYGYSDWKDWNSSDGRLVSSLVDETLVPDNFDGKYRLLVINQFLYICFNDREMTSIQLNNYYGDYDAANPKKNDLKVSVKQSSADVFEYDATLHSEAAQQFYGKKTYVRLEKKSEAQFTYKLEVDGNLYASETMTNYKADYGSASFPKMVEEYEWLPKKGMNFHSSVSNGASFKVSEHLLSIDRTDYLPMYYCFEGISLRDIDEKNKTVSYNFLDAGKNGYCDYFEIKIDSFDDRAEEYKKYRGALTFYKIENEEPRVLYRYTTQWIDENTDFNENSVQFF